MTTLKSTVNNNVATYKIRKDGRIEVYFSYEVDGIEYLHELKVYATEKTALSKINKYLS